MLTTNMFGDILSDQAAEMVGGLGLGGSINAGDDHAVAQAAHGAAPDIAGKDVANPLAASSSFYWVSGAGALVQLLLLVAHSRFLWWPIHPIAFPVSAFWTTHHLMPSIFLAQG